MSSWANPYFEVVDSLKIPAERYRAAHAMSAGGRGARENRGKQLPAEKIEALIWGLSHENPVVRRCCLELLDQHPDVRAVPHILAALEDPVPRVRWHAVHALACDGCKAGESFIAPNVVAKLRRVATQDRHARVRNYAIRILSARDSAR
jgi:HEAT repeat protein